MGNMSMMSRYMYDEVNEARAAK